MEPTEIETQSTPINEPELLLTPEAKYYLYETAKWANFLSIVGFVMCAIMFITALFIGAIFSFLGQISPVYSQIPSGVGTVITVLFILLDALYFFFPYYLYKFAATMKNALALSSKEQVAESLGKLKSFFKLAGIVTIVMLVIYAIEIIGIVLVVAAMPR